MEVIYLLILHFGLELWTLIKPGARYMTVILSHFGMCCPIKLSFQRGRLASLRLCDTTGLQGGQPHYVKSKGDVVWIHLCDYGAFLPFI